MTPEKVTGIDRFTESKFLLSVGAVAGFFVANYAHEWYEKAAHGSVSLSLPDFGWTGTTTTHFIVVDVLMVLFFFVIGSHLKIQFTDENGAFHDKRNAIAPMVGAVGGVVFPAAICLVIAGQYGAKAFGVPMATDIAFTLALAGILGFSKAETAFLVALAIIDDIIGVLVIAFFYNDGLDPLAVLTAVMASAVLFWIGRRGVSYKGVYLVGMAVLWYLFHEANIHPTLAGVVAGFAAPHDGTADSTANRIERVFENWFQPIVLCAFAFVSCGIYLPELAGDALKWSVASGIALGLVVGKPLGIIVFLMMLKKFAGVEPSFSMKRALPVGCLAGIGFTVALFVNDLAFDDPGLLISGKAGVIVGSFASAFLGWAFHLMTRKHLSQS